MYKASIPGVYTLARADRALPLVFDSPHSGTHYPDDFDYSCDFSILQQAEDKYVDQLFDSAPAQGAALLCAEFPRSYIDLNRCEKDIDHALLEDIWPEESSPTARAHAGIGLVRRLLKPGIPLYDRHLGTGEIRQRIGKYYRPYHVMLKKLLDEAHYTYGAVWHVNCHSMPGRHPLFSGGNFGSPHRPGGGARYEGGAGRMPDFVLGDRDGTSCALDFTHALRDFLQKLGYRVAINDPYKGVELVRRYSSPAEGRHSIQIEIAKSLYMDEESCKKSKRYDAFKKDIERLIGFCTTYVRAQALPVAAD